MVRLGGHEALGETLQKSLGSRAISIEKGRRRSEQQDVAIARARTHSLFGKRQETGLTTGIRDRRTEVLFSARFRGRHAGNGVMLDLGRLWRLLPQRTERQDQLRRRGRIHMTLCRYAGAIL